MGMHRSLLLQSAGVEMLPARRRLTVVVSVLLITLLAGLWSESVHVQVRSGLYTLFRTAQQSAVLAGALRMPALTGAHFVVYYPPGEESAARLVLEAAERVFEPTVQQVGYRPAGRIPVLMHPDRQSIRDVFGWAEGQSATGVYWAGVIRVLSPAVWVYAPTEEEWAERFRALNPLAHEFTHYLLDYMSGGNYPRWYTEGLAQLVEADVTGYMWLEPASSLRQPLYTLAELEGDFDALPNQALAYRQSHLLVRYLSERCGEGGLQRLNALLATAPSVNSAVAAECGLPAGSLEPGWRAWVRVHDADLEAELQG